jgi:trehalose 2-sulfotransferase
MASVSETESTEWDLERYVEAPRTYIIASQPRSGSHYLAHLLRQTGQAGVPLEYFHTLHWKRWVKRTSRTNPLSAFRILCQRRTTANGVFGVKMHWKQFQLACRLRLESEFEQASFIQISREDLLGQAISLVIASQTGAWVHEHEAQRAPEYSFEAIHQAMGRLIDERGHWDRFFACTQIQPLRISYENLTNDLDSTMRSVCQHLGIVWNVTDLTGPRVQRTERSDEWRDRYVTTLPTLHEPNCFWRGEFGLVNRLADDSALA